MDLSEWEPKIADPFADLLPIFEREPKTCPKCGTTQADLHNDGRMGCAECYRVFASEVRRALLVLHGANRHVGKDP